APLHRTQRRVLGQEPSRALPRQAALGPADRAAGRPGRLPAMWLPAVALALAVAGCTSVADVTGTAPQSDLMQVRGEVAAAQQAAQRARSDAQTAAPPPTAPPAAATPPPAAPGARPATDALQPQDIYQAAYIDFSKGSYALAMAGFREFLRRFPDHPLAGNAQYWIGEGYYSQARVAANAGQSDKVAPELEQAVQEFRKVLANYPRSEKAPTALYKEALA